MLDPNEEGLNDVFLEVAGARKSVNDLIEA